jgi:hypothetical protein
VTIRRARQRLAYSGALVVAAASMVAPQHAAEAAVAASPAVSLVPGDQGAARLGTSTATLVRKTLLSQLSPPVPDSSGIVYLSDVDRLLIADSEVNEMPIYQGVNMWQISRTGAETFDTGTTLPFSKEPTGIAYDPVGKRLFVSDDDKELVSEFTAGPDGRIGTADDVVTSFSTLAFGNDDAEDVTYDSSSGDLFVTQGGAQEVWRVSPGPNGRFDGVAPTGDDVVSHFDLSVYGSLDIEGLAYSAVRDSLFVADRRVAQVLEVTKTGALRQRIDTAAIKMRAPAGITLAPATDDPTRTSMYIVTRGRDNNTWPDENDGTLFELTAPDLGPITLAPNEAPSASAGPDRAVSLPGSALLAGTASDDGRPDPPGQLKVTWSKASGPGTVVFAHANAPETTAGFTQAGTYVLRLSVTDSELTVIDEVTIVVSGSGAQKKATCQGTSGLLQVGPKTDDVLIGTQATDIIRGERGNDLLLGRGGGDCLVGGPGKDRLRGQAGADRLDPGPGKDTATGGGGNDVIVSVDGKRDVVQCGGGRDRVTVDKRDRVAASCERVVVKAIGG